MRSRILLASLAVAALAAGGNPAIALPTCAEGGAEWYGYGGDRANSRNQWSEATVGPAEVPSLAMDWSFNAATVAQGGGGTFSNTPVVADGCVYVASSTGFVMALNAEDGALVWASDRMPGSPAGALVGGVITGSPVVDNGKVYVAVSRLKDPFIGVLDQETGETLGMWSVLPESNRGDNNLYRNTIIASPVVWNGLIFQGIMADEASAVARGGWSVLDANTGEILANGWTIDDASYEAGYRGASIWCTPALDEETGFVYACGGNPASKRIEHANANALLKVDLDRTSDSFGEILASYKGDSLDHVIPGYSSMPCEDLPTPAPPAIVPTGRGIGACGDIDVDFAASPNLFTGMDGRALVGTSQKSGRFHAVDAATMDGVWTSTIGPAQPFGGVSASYDGSALYSGGAPPGYVVALEPAGGALEWAAPIADGAHYGIPVASANGVVYSLGLTGTLNAIDAATGVPLLSYPLVSATGIDGPFTFGGVSVARNTVYAAVGIQNTGLDPVGYFSGYVVAFRAA